LSVCAIGLVLGRVLRAAGIGQHRYLVAKLEPVARGTRRVALTPLSRGVRPAPGQFVYVQLQPCGEAHPFTVSHYGETSGTLSITPKAEGPFSRRLLALQPGDQVWVSGPFGTFTQEASTTVRPVVLIADGIGITAFLRLLCARADGPGPTPLTLIYANRAPEDAAFWDDLDAIAERDRSVKIVHVFSDSAEDNGLPTTGRVTVEHGRVNEPVLRAHLPHAIEAGEYFLCGPPQMMDAVMAALVRMGTPSAQIHRERFSSDAV
jgi:ferredoxin-NADP reductase